VWHAYEDDGGKVLVIEIRNSTPLEPKPTTTNKLEQDPNISQSHILYTYVPF